MNIVWLSWKDMKHPQAGGAEFVNETLAKQLALHGHKVKLVTASFDGALPREIIDGYEVIRVGNRFSVYYRAWRYYKSELLDEWADLVIDEVNTVPFFAKFYTRKPTLLFVHMLCREIWWYQIFFPASLVGYLAEPLYLRLLNKQKVITVSESTQKDLMRYGYKKDYITIIPEIIGITPMKSTATVVKYTAPTMLSLGQVRPMKRTLDIIKAFELAKATIPKLRLVIAGDTQGRYGRKVLRAVKRSKFASDIKYVGRVSAKQKQELMQKSHLIAVTSIKEGWGLVVSEAASQGTPAIVYNADGLRDSVIDGKTGVITKENTPASLARAITNTLYNKHKYDKIRVNAFNFAKDLTEQKSYKAFWQIIEAER